jgi:hypothetical protein
MLTISTQQLQSVFERILRDKNGVLVRVRFTVVEMNGAFVPQIISATPLVSKIDTAEDAICLPCAQDQKVVAEDATPSFISKVSPYFSLDFFMSQPTRAPSYR